MFDIYILSDSASVIIFQKKCIFEPKMSFFKSTAYRYHKIRSAMSAARRTPGSPAGREAGVIFAQAKSMTVGLSGAAVRYVDLLQQLGTNQPIFFPSNLDRFASPNGLELHNCYYQFFQ